MHTTEKYRKLFYNYHCWRSDMEVWHFEYFIDNNSLSHDRIPAVGNMCLPVVQSLWRQSKPFSRIQKASRVVGMRSSSTSKLKWKNKESKLEAHFYDYGSHMTFWKYSAAIKMAGKMAWTNLYSDVNVWLHSKYLWHSKFLVSVVVRLFSPAWSSTSFHIHWSNIKVWITL